MVEIPDDVESWTYGKIVDLVNEGYDENEILEFKKEINSDPKRLCQTVCAFANTKGGTIIFGIDNNRTTPLHLHDRITGLDDLDQLKRNIIDKIKNLKPNIPINNTVFKKTNIHLPNKKVLVIMKILPSEMAPHQYEHIFYKRITGGNEPMDVDEVKQIVLISQKKDRLLTLLRQECGFIRDKLKDARKYSEQGDLSTAMNICGDLSVDATLHFLFDQSYLYSENVSNILMRIIELIDKLGQSANKMSELNELSKEQKSHVEKALTIATQHWMDKALKHLENLGTHLNVDLIPSVIDDEFVKKVDVVKPDPLNKS